MRAFVDGVEMGTSRKKVLFAGFAGLAGLVALAVWLVFVRFDGDTPVVCATGYFATNPTDATGKDLVRQERFATVEGAETFLCVDLKQVTNTDGWRATGAIATRTNSLDYYDEGSFVAGDEAFKYSQIFYSNDQMQAQMTLIVYPDEVVGRLPTYPSCFGVPPDSRPWRQDQVTIQGVQATMWIREAAQSPLAEPRSSQPSAAVCWRRGGWNYFASVNHLPGFVPVQMLPILDSIR
jgi:hypothetical protein